MDTKKQFKRFVKKVINFRIPKFMKSFYFVTAFALFIWMLFFDANDFISQYKWRKKYNKLQREKAYYQELHNNLRQNVKDYNQNENFEKFAREKHLLQKPNEDVFIIIEEE
jgi:cell division protein FtsB